MNFSKKTKKTIISENKDTYNHLLDSLIPNISLPNQDGNLLNLKRKDTFKLIIYCYPMTGHPKKPLPRGWNSIPGATGCTLQTCSFRDQYDELIKLNALPIGLSTQSIADIKEMTLRLNIPYDIVSDINLELVKKIDLPTFKIDNKIYIKRLTLIVEQSKIKCVFFPIFSPQNNIFDVLKWLKKNQS